MKFAGIDVGAQSVKSVIIEDDAILGAKLKVTESEGDTAARDVYHELLRDLDITQNDVSAVFATGFGANEVSFANRRSSQQVCAARGARWLIPSARMVVDMGAEGCRAIRFKPDGTMDEFADNSKCASGTGAFIELGAVYLKVSLDEIGPLSLRAGGDAADLSSVCAVFAESSIISAIHSGESKERIAAGIRRSAAEKVVELVGRLGMVEEIVLVGGPASNFGLTKAIESISNIRVQVPERPQFAVALGAAIQASLRTKSQPVGHIAREV
jgi:predicted CoA-substrate-specific enzyme activase